MRRLENWLEGWMEYMEPVASPTLFKKWAGLSLIAGALERKVWTYVPAYKSNLYPNLYMFFIAPPGVGKTVLTSHIQEFYKELTEHHLAPMSVSRASLMDALNDAQRHVIINERAMTFNSMMVIVDELNVFLVEYATEFISVLTHIYDCKPFGEKKRGNNLDYKMTAPQMSFIGATTPAQLQTLLPENAYDHGFMSRVIMVYAGGVTKVDDLFVEQKSDEVLRMKLIGDLKEIAATLGPYRWVDEAKFSFNKWYRDGGKPAPSHPRLAGYNQRRPAHLLKLMMVSSVCRDSKLILTEGDFELARDWLTECEGSMESVFTAMKAGSERDIMVDCAHFILRINQRQKRGVREAVILEFLQNRGIPGHSVERILRLMVLSELLEQRVEGYFAREVTSTFGT